METTQQLLSLIDDNKEKLTDGVYKEICDKLAELNKVPVGYVKVTGFMVKATINKNDDEDEEDTNDCSVFHAPRCEILQVVDGIPIGNGLIQRSGCDLPRKMVCCETYEKMNAELPDRGYYHLFGTVAEMGELNEKYFVTRMEALK